MKTTLAFFILCLSLLANGQNDCEVKPEALKGSYSGECRNGLAHGEGEAHGEDYYEGNFRKGLPHGKGRYIWSNGDIYEGGFRKGLRHGEGKFIKMVDGEQVVIEGFWRKGKQDKKRSTEQEYRIDRQRSIDYVRIMEAGSGEKVRVKIWRAGSMLSYRNLRVHHDSGTYRLIGEEIMFEYVNFPFTFSVFYTVPNKMKTGSMDCELQVTINTPGSWEVITNQ